MLIHYERLMKDNEWQKGCLKELGK
jgi:hypothetical protein